MNFCAEVLEKIFGIVLKIYELVKPFVEVDTRRARLSNVLLELVSTMEDMERKVQNELRQQPGKTRKRVVDAYFRQSEGFKVSAQAVLDRSHARYLMLKRMTWVPSIERHHQEGRDLLSKGRQLQHEGLTFNKIRTHGEMLPLEEDQYMVPTVRALLESVMQAIKDGDNRCIGIYGYPGSGKTNLMKHLYNRIFQDRENFKAVFWATAPDFDPDQPNYYKTLQNCVADAMWVDLDNDVIHDEMRNAGKINARLQDIGPGRAVFFLDNVKAEFPAYELLGIPSPLSTEYDSVKCILIFSTLSKEVCNRMCCDSPPLKMELLEEEEAKELFLNEVRRGVNNFRNQILSNHERRIQETAIKVAKECKRMPLAIIVIARAMVNTESLHEWNNRLNELTGRITRINEEEDVILEQLKFGYLCLKEETVRRCFIEAAKEFANNHRVSKGEIIEMWQRRGLIIRQGDTGIDQGHTILNQLERMCFLQVAPDHETLTMNKWIWKMADKVSRETT